MLLYVNNGPAESVLEYRDWHCSMGKLLKSTDQADVGKKIEILRVMFTERIEFYL